MSMTSAGLSCEGVAAGIPPRMAKAWLQTTPTDPGLLVPWRRSGTAASEQLHEALLRAESQHARLRIRVGAQDADLVPALLACPAVSSVVVAGEPSAGRAIYERDALRIGVLDADICDAFRAAAAYGTMPTRWLPVHDLRVDPVPVDVLVTRRPLWEPVLEGLPAAFIVSASRDERESGAIVADLTRLSVSHGTTAAMHVGPIPGTWLVHSAIAWETLMSQGWAPDAAFTAAFHRRLLLVGDVAALADDVAV